MHVERDDASACGRRSRTWQRWWRRNYLLDACCRGDASGHGTLLANWELRRGCDDGAVSNVKVTESAGRVLDAWRGRNDNGLRSLKCSCRRLANIRRRRYDGALDLWCEARQA